MQCRVKFLISAVVTDVWIGISCNSTCGKPGTPSCHMDARWSDGSLYDETLVPSLTVPFRGPDIPPRWKPSDKNLNDNEATFEYNVVCEYTCGC